MVINQGRRQGAEGRTPPIDMLGPPSKKLTLLKTAAFVLILKFNPPDKRLTPLG